MEPQIWTKIDWNLIEVACKNLQWGGGSGQQNLCLATSVMGRT